MKKLWDIHKAPAALVTSPYANQKKLLMHIVSFGTRKQVGKVLKKRKAIVEIGDGQASADRHIFETEGLKLYNIGYDLAGKERCIIASRKEKFRVKQKKGLE